MLSPNDRCQLSCRPWRQLSPVTAVSGWAIQAAEGECRFHPKSYVVKLPETDHDEC